MYVPLPAESPRIVSFPGGAEWGSHAFFFVNGIYGSPVSVFPLPSRDAYVGRGGWWGKRDRLTPRAAARLRAVTRSDPGRPEREGFIITKSNIFYDLITGAKTKETKAPLRGSRYMHIADNVHSVRRTKGQAKGGNGVGRSPRARKEECSSIRRRTCILLSHKGRTDGRA